MLLGWKHAELASLNVECQVVDQLCGNCRMSRTQEYEKSGLIVLVLSIPEASPINPLDSVDVAWFNAPVRNSMPIN